MTIKSLKKCKEIRRHIDDIQERIIRLRSAAENLSRQLQHGSGGKDHKDMLAKYISSLDGLEISLAKQSIKLEKQYANVEKWLTVLPEQQEKIMRYRYVGGLKWKDVARRTGYSYRHCTKIHAAALKKLAPNAPKIYDKV